MSGVPGGLGVCIQAGGRGTRLSGALDGGLKALAPLARGTLLSYQLGRARALAPERLVVIGQHRIDALRAALGVEAELLVEAVPLDTAGGLVLLPAEPETWLVVNVDHVGDVDWEGLVASHRGAATAVVYAQPHEIPEGVVEVEAGRIVRYRERPVLRVDVTVGLSVFSRAALRRVLHGQPCGMPALIEALVPEGVGVWRHPGTWLDAGTPERLARAERWLEGQGSAAAAELGQGGDAAATGIGGDPPQREVGEQRNRGRAEVREGGDHRPELRAGGGGVRPRPPEGAER
jgi:NDP-sugar pyrophosphorylase family protein